MPTHQSDADYRPFQDATTATIHMRIDNPHTTAIKARGHERASRVGQARGKDPGYNDPSVANRIGSEEDPGECHQGEYESCLASLVGRGPGKTRVRSSSLVPNRPRAWTAPQRTNVQAAPCQRPERTIVRKMFRYVLNLPLRLPAERDVDIVFEPGRETDVPTAPEFAQARGQVGVVEVEHQTDAHHPGDASAPYRYSR